jgi:tRNA (guanine26-N2/guanine27-N2)-dimethyltransferase
MSLSQVTVPDGFTLHSENSAHILLPNDNGAFLNPIQEFNRDLSVACITTWANEANQIKTKRRELALAKKARKDEQQGKAKKQRSTLYILFSYKYWPLN